MSRPSWEQEVGAGQSRVVVYANADRKNKLTLRWRKDGNWKKETLDRALRFEGKKPHKDDVEFALAAAMKKSLELQGKLPAVATAESRPLLTIAEAEALITDRETGKYPHRDSFRDELSRSLRIAAVLWGADTPWASIDEPHWTLLIRRRLGDLLARGKKGNRATEITVSRLITAVRWLRAKKHIPRDAAAWPDDWKDEVVKEWKGVTGSARDPEPFRPRHSAEEALAILKHSTFDPRFNLMMWTGMELRLGQVARTRRSDLRLPVIDWSKQIDPEKDDTDYGTMHVHGAGKKKGTTVDLARGQRAMIEYSLSADGYLGALEQRYQAKELEDYALFPSGYIVGRVGNDRGQSNRLTLSGKIDPQKNVTGSWIRKSFRNAEKRAGIEHVTGRCGYGVRRAGVDLGSAVLSPAGLKNFGGWHDIKMPEQIYKERENKSGAREARSVRAKLRGNLVPHFGPKGEGEK